MSTLKAHAAGSKCPPLADGTLRVYSMRFCPYAQRTLLVLNHLNIPHEVVNVNLKSKPEWYFSKNPGGLVPTLEQGDKLINESSICDEYLADLHDSKKSLIPADPYAKARAKMTMELFSKVESKFYGLFRASTEEEKKKGVDEIRIPLTTFENKLAGKFFGGDELSMIDIHIWPWFERLPALQKIIGIDVLPVETFPKLNTWVDRMKQTSAVKAVLHDPDRHATFISSYINGGQIDYDLGL